MKRIRVFAVVLSSCLLVTMMGCASAIPELSDDEQAMVTQYMADLLLEYDANYRDSLLDQEELGPALEEQFAKEEAARLEAEEQARLEQEKIEASKPDDIEVDVTPSYASVDSMATASGLDGVDFEYLGYELSSQYPASGEGELVFAMTPSEGNQLLVLKFNMANISGSDYEMDMIKSGIGYAIKINDGSYAPALTTLLDNDLSTLGTLIPVESGMEVVIISEVPAGTQVNSIILYVRGQNANMEIKLQ